MKHKLSILLMCITASQISYAGDAVAQFDDLAAIGWLTGSTHWQIAKELEEFEEQAFSAVDDAGIPLLSDDEIQDALWLEAPGSPGVVRKKKCYFYGRTRENGQDRCRNGDACEFWHKKMTDEEKREAKIEKKKRKKAAYQYKRYLQWKEQQEQQEQEKQQVDSLVNSNDSDFAPAKLRKNYPNNHNGQHQQHCSTTEASSTHSHVHRNVQKKRKPRLPKPLLAHMPNPYYGGYDPVVFTYNSKTGLYFANYFGLVYAWNYITNYFVWSNGPYWKTQKAEEWLQNLRRR